MLELNKTTIKRDGVTYRERYFVDRVEKGLCGTVKNNLFNSESEDECISFMRSYRETCN